MLHQKRLVAGRRDLCHKNHIVGVNDRLRLVGQVRMNRVPHLMRQCKLAVQRSRVVEQHIRMHARARRIRARALAGVLIDVNPAVLESLLQNRRRSARPSHRVPALRSFSPRQREFSPATLQSAAYKDRTCEARLTPSSFLRRRIYRCILSMILVHGLDQRMVHAHRNLRCVQRRFQRGGYTGAPSRKTPAA